MTDDIKPDNQQEAAGADTEQRRDFLKKAAKVGMTAPAVSMLLSSQVKAQVDNGYGNPEPSPEPTPPPMPTTMEPTTTPQV